MYTVKKVKIASHMTLLYIEIIFMKGKQCKNNSIIIRIFCSAKYRKPREGIFCGVVLVLG